MQGTFVAETNIQAMQNISTGHFASRSCYSRGYMKGLLCNCAVYWMSPEVFTKSEVRVSEVGLAKVLDQLHR